MEIRSERVGDIAVVAVLCKTLDAGNHDRFKSALMPIVAQTPGVVLDVSQLDFVDSSGLGAILTCLRKARSGGGNLKLLCGSSRPVRMFFELVRIHGVIDVYETREEALESFVSRV
ncbi:MAG TPA: STAS domain-containing protein [Phycisphaerae bacterium]|nr:STAS domain-containing protein [Phycisphaerae bacterium]